jgi:HD-GYP domain-containing protein (c-di-GMP phosphodiesterase class II)
MATHTRAAKPSPVVTPQDERLPSALALLNGLNHVTRSLVPYDPEGTSLSQVVERAGRVLRPDGMAILVRERPGEYKFQVTHGVLCEWDQFTLSGPGSLLLDTLLERNSVVIFHRKQRSPWTREFLYAAGMSWGALAPIRANDEPIGALLMNHSSLLPVRAEHVAAIEGLAALAGVAVREDRHRARVEELFMSVIVSLTTAIEAKDPYTEGHSARVAAYSEAIGKQLGLSPERLDVIHRACLVHDIGKIGVDGTILGKGAALSSQERERMDQHPQIGEAILWPIEMLRPLLPGVRHHHEKYDGTGYPDGLAGEAIPIEARIMAVADAFDAMTSNRPYRNALPEEDSLDELKRNAGTHFDPRVVAAFEQIFPAVKRTLQHVRPRGARKEEAER